MTEQGCKPVKELHYTSQKAWLGYSIQAVKGADIQPSIIYLMKNDPPKWIVNPSPGSGRGYIEYEMEAPTCLDSDESEQYYVFDIIQKYGVVGTDCIPNTAAPSRTDACTQTGGKYEKQLIGYKELNSIMAIVIHIKKL
ncbi:MAG: hypothetical protein EZS28_003376 [Streblomastix strix]|uniref:Uncharacterized protein n=1 Tax=Streblomastix strix TaxID=222440 RepID=A0A5J4X379_9EUKA|nr:MAG: hypothetical protein EZS28_003376 [Streblomastix strix]